MGSPVLVASRTRGPLLGNIEENLLNRRLEPIRVVDGYRIQLRTSGHFASRPLELAIQVSYYSVGDSFPYLGQVQLGQRGFRIPKSGTLQVALFNPMGTIDKLFVLIYDLSDMPPNSQTFLRQKTILVPRNQIRYMIQFNIVSSRSGKVYLQKDLRVVILKETTNAEELKSYDEMPNNPRYSSR